MMLLLTSWRQPMEHPLGRSARDRHLMLQTRLLHQGAIPGMRESILEGMAPAYEALVGDLSGAYSRRINIQRRLLYQVLDKERREYLSSRPGQIGMHD